ncbi:hypothetical protein E2C01_043193 [Portunus trituberculatus]|uniref:Uncharacterized protein n=1 Tax=Portunus trituberculatus TaxID=210409 RepID=A0A5B7FYW1_PORTR|nr:hypothetical protein [Portunus trituberculatus]
MKRRHNQLRKGKVRGGWGSNEERRAKEKERGTGTELSRSTHPLPKTQPRSSSKEFGVATTEKLPRRCGRGGRQLNYPSPNDECRRHSPRWEPSGQRFFHVRCTPSPRHSPAGSRQTCERRLFARLEMKRK